MEVPNANVLLRTLWLRCGPKFGTGFTIEVESRQYLVTAGHVVEHRKTHAIEAFLRGRWQALDLRYVAPDPDFVDIAVFAPSGRLTVAHPTILGSKGVVLGQDLFILGYPFDPSIGRELMHVADGGPIPMVKGGRLAAMMRAPGAGHSSLLVDCYGNEGFSGGPLVGFLASGAGRAIGILAVVSHYVPESKPVVAAGQRTALTAEHNPGILVALDISHAIDGIHVAGPMLGAPPLASEG